MQPLACDAQCWSTHILQANDPGARHGAVAPLEHAGTTHACNVSYAGRAAAVSRCTHASAQRGSAHASVQPSSARHDKGPAVVARAGGAAATLAVASAETFAATRRASASCDREQDAPTPSATSATTARSPRPGGMDEE